MKKGDNAIELGLLASPTCASRGAENNPIKIKLRSLTITSFGKIQGTATVRWDGCYLKTYVHHSQLGKTLFPAEVSEDTLKAGMDRIQAEIIKQAERSLANAKIAGRGTARQEKVLQSARREYVILDERK